MKYALIVVFLLIVIILVFLILKILPLLTAKPTIKVNYLAEYNKVTKPADYDPNQNAAPYYKKAFEILTDIPEAIKDNWKDWPADMDDKRLNVLKSWLASNSQAFSYLEQAAQKPFCWNERYGTDDAIFNIELPELSKFPMAVHALSLQAKSNALQGQIELAFTQVIELHQMGLHYSGPLTLVEQLIGIGVSGLAFNTAFAIIDRVEVNSETIVNFQDSLEQQLQKSKHLNFTIGESVYSLDIAQRMFTDDDNGDGSLIPSKLFELDKRSPLTPHISYAKAILICLNHPGRRETLKLQKKLYQELDKIVFKTPWQLRQNGTSYQDHVQKLTKGNYYLNDDENSLGRLCEIYQKHKVSGEALVATLAILRYKIDKGNFPVSLQELVLANYINKLPIDPYSEGPLVYKRMDGNFILYSLGADFDDDGGMSSKWGEGEQGGDQVFWPIEQ